MSDITGENFSGLSILDARNKLINLSLFVKVYFTIELRKKNTSKLW